MIRDRVPRPPSLLLLVAVPLVVLLVGGAASAPAAPASRVLAAGPAPVADRGGTAIRSPRPAARPADPAADRFAEAPTQLGGRHRRLAPVPPEELSGYVWPLHGARLTLGFGETDWGSRRVDGKLFHDGLDIATFCGDPVVAAHDGVVLAAGRQYDDYMGWLGDLSAYTRRLDEKKLWLTLPIVVVTDDGNGYRSIYAHFGRVVVKPGQAVRAGQLIGYEGMTGRASGCHLHYGLFSPLETRTFGLDAAVADRLLLPSLMIARVDPLRVLPPAGSAGIH